ncbi:MAG TPA: cytochrome c [Candidatus Angelobacter sp.]|nr:cytochrome c [Candidatus Angelobacter sp.]
MHSRLICIVAIILLVCSVGAAAQTAAPTTAPQAAKPEIKHVQAAYTDPSSGKEMYAQYCASCHGMDGKGDGPAAAALKMPTTNLTMLATKNGGTFPAAHVAAVIQGDSMTPAHGSKDMPVWGPIFRSMSGHSQAQVQLRIRNLTNYLESIQAK